MPIATDQLIEVVFNMNYNNNQVLNVWQYKLGTVIGTIGLVQLLEAYWNNIKVNYRAVFCNNVGNLFLTLKGRELNNVVGDFAEYDIPLAEQTGTRAPLSPTDQFPLFVTAGVRLVVGTRMTRPGQKRFSPIQETDAINGVMSSVLKTPLNTLMTQMTNVMTMGAPALTVDMHPIVCRKDTSGFVTASQPPTGFLINNNLTSQNTRKYGRGA